MNFKGKKEIIGMIHLAGPNIVDKAMEEIAIFEEEGLSGIIIENYHSETHNISAVLAELKVHPTKLSVGINVLPNEFQIAYDIAEKYEMVDFIQLDYIAGKYGCLNNPQVLDADAFIERSMLARPIAVYGGVWPKYYTPHFDSILSVDLFDGVFLADAIVVTGDATGSETPLDKIIQFNELIDGKVPLIIGAGLNQKNVKEQLQYAQGAIVGSAFKPNGKTRQMVDRDLVQEFMNQVNSI